MKKILITLTAMLSGLVVLISSCTKDFEEINTNPNEPGTDLAGPDLLLTNAIEQMTDRVHEIFLGHEMGSCWVQHIAKVQYTDEDRYIPRVGVINNTWQSFYASSGSDINTLYEYAVSKDHKNYQGVALVLKCYIVSVLTDLYGNIPYSQAWKAAGDAPIASPVYDSQESIYRDLITQLE
ncbi:MAG: SusD/RagB family nutrient-binding outer membrane lipoprotein, partial [Bacteroidia bacterium]|nr:SusD/RagB family nutrient-binding outer membrane lipoprotein [Bacteroidia bacterium]